MSNVLLRYFRQAKSICMNPLITVQQLSKILNDPNLVVLDASMANNKSGVAVDNENQQIKGARFFDIKNKFSDTKSKFPNTIPIAEQFQEEAQILGINHNSRIVVYDNLGIYTSPRVWWLFKTFGHKNISVLNGGLPEWLAQGYPTEEKTISNYKKGDFTADLKTKNVRYFTDVKSNLKAQEELVVDARSSGRFNGTSPEPRKDLRGGCIPGSVNIPYTEVLENGKYKSKQELKAIFESQITNEQPLVFSCGSGITACIILLASEIIGKKETAVYDGSWTEWAQLEPK